MKATIGINLKVTGFHFYPLAPDDVSFLKDNHRHTFGIEVVIEVTELNRELEFFMVQETIRLYLDEVYDKHMGGYKFGAISCETIAKDLLNYFPRFHSVKVDEDGENWGKVER